MKQFIITILFNSVIFCAFSQVNMTAKWPQFETDTVFTSYKTIDMDVGMSGKSLANDELNNNRAGYNLTNIEVSRNPVEVVITNDDQFAFVRCFLSN